jgi:creatinine amidohydrolase
LPQSQRNNPVEQGEEDAHDKGAQEKVPEEDDFLALHDSSVISNGGIDARLSGLRNLREFEKSMHQLRDMRISEMNWMMVEEFLGRDDRAVLPLGSTEQHAYLSLSVDSILAERLGVEAAEPLGVPVFPVLAYGITPYFRAFPGTITLRVETYMSILRDILDAMAEQGFKRILIVNGHGGNTPAQGLVGEWMADHPGVRIKFHNWWNAPKVWVQVEAIDPVASHASWMENFPWTRLAKTDMPHQKKPMSDPDKLRQLDPKSLREYLKDGNYGGLYQRDDEEMMKIWRAGVEETRALLTEGWD